MVKGTRIRGIIIKAASAALAVTMIMPRGLSAAEPLDISSTTYLHAYGVDNATGPDQTFTSLYEYLAAGATSLGRPEISFSLTGWGRADLGDDHPDGSTAGELTSAFLTYSAPQGNGQARVGRFFLAEGTATESLDGLFLKGTFRGGFGGAAFVGSPAQAPGAPDGRGSTLSGGRAFFILPGLAEVGVSYLREDGDYGDGDREEAGCDLWVRPTSLLDVTGSAVYNRVTSGLASHRLVLSVYPLKTLTLSAGSEGYDYVDLFSTVLNPALAAFGGTPDSVSSGFAIVDWQATDALALGVSGRSIRHELDDPGSAFKGEASVRLSLGNGSLAGLSAGRLTADTAGDEYDEVRGYLMTAYGPWKISLDALTQRFGAPDPASGEDRTYLFVGSLGRRIISSTRLSADVRYTKSPRFEEDVAVLLRAEMDLGGR